ncbi:MAG: sulfotransferase [Pseudomonadota bacterium]
MIESLSPRAAFNKAVNLIATGKLREALAVCESVLVQDSNEVTMLALHGATLLKMGDAEAAEKQLRAAIDLAPAFAKPREDLGFLLFHADRAGEAVEQLHEATRLDPSSEQAWMLLGRALGNLGRGGEADAAFDKAFALNPERRNLALAAEHHKNSRLDEAEALYRGVLNDNPENVDALRLLASILAHTGRADEAESLLQRAVSKAPDFARAWVDLGELLFEQHRLFETVDCLEKAVELEPKRPRIHYLLAAALAPLGRTHDALAAYRHALELKPDHAGALLGVGHTLKTIGKQQEAIDAYRECIRLRPDNGESYWSLANLKTYKLNRADIEQMQSVIAKHDELSPQSMVNFLFALAKASEDAGAYEQAWDYYQRGNNKQRELERYDAVQTEVTNDEIIDVFSEELFAKFQGAGCQDSAPIFVVGLPRSGSTLIEQILASHSQIEGTSELPYAGRVATSLNRNRADGVNYPHAVSELGPRQFEAMGLDYLRRAQVHRAEGKPFFVDKMPNNFPTVGLIQLILPKAKIIDARRYPLDSCFSCYRQLFAKGQSFVYDLNDIGEYFLEYQRLMDHWHKVLPGRILTVQYEDMVTDQEAQIRRLIEYCELPWEDACLRFYETDRAVRTASSEQVRQPVYTSSVHYWRNFEQHLQPLIDVLKPVLARYQHYESINR